MLVIGCSRETGDVKTGLVSVFDLSPKEVLASVNGHDVSVGDYLDRYNLELSLYRLKRRRKGVDVKAERRFLDSRVRMILAQLINFELVKEYLSKNAITSGTNEEAVVRGFARRFGHKGDFTSFATEVGVAPDYLREQILFTDRVRVAREHFDAGCLVVTEKEIDEGLARQDRYYARAVASNRVTWVTCSNTLAKVRSGLDFAEVGAKFGGTEREEAKRWDSFEPEDIENEGLRQWAFSAPVGTVGGPFDLEDGLCLVKILSRTAGTMVDSAVSEGVAEVELARITYPMVVEEPEPRTRDFVKKSLLKWKADRAQKALFDHLHAAMRLDYPQGTNFCYKGEMEK